MSKLLPIGSIVKLRKSNALFIISNVKVEMEVEMPGNRAIYTALPYQSTELSEEKYKEFTLKDVDKVISIGYSDPAHRVMNIIMKASINVLEENEDV